jgi:hypothetical protein
MERINPTSLPAYHYIRRITAGQLAAQASSASAALAASAAPGSYTLAMLGRRTTPPNQDANLATAA